MTKICFIELYVKISNESCLFFFFNFLRVSRFCVFFKIFANELRNTVLSSSILFLWSLLMRSTPEYRNSVRHIFCQQFPVAFILYNESVDKDEKSSKGL